MRQIELEDIRNVICANNVRFSPDGKYAAWVTIASDMEHNSYNNNISLADTDTKQVRQMTHTGRCGSFIWDSTDTLLFATERDEKDSARDIEEKTSFYRLPVNGGEAYCAFRIKANVTGIKKISEGKYLLKVLHDRNRPDPSAVSEEECREEKDYHIFEEVPFWGNGRGYISGKRYCLFLFDEKTEELTKITHPDANVSWFDARNGKIGYTCRTFRNLMPEYGELHVYDPETGTDTMVVGPDTLRMDTACIDDTGIYFAASDLKTYGHSQLSDLYRYDFNAETYEKIFDNGIYAIGSTPMADTMRPGGDLLHSTEYGLYFQAMKGYSTNLYKLNGNTVETALDLGEGAIACLDVSGDRICFSASEKGTLNRICFGSLKDGTYEVIEDLNPWLDECFVSESIPLPFVNSAGIPIEGWALKPYGYDPKQTYPGILEIHGGPRAAYGQVFYHEMQAWASKGYFVFFCNPRGSEGKGEEFADLRGKYGTIDYQDLMEFTDHVLKEIPQIDPKRLGVSGGSYGGFMCNWIEGHTDRFKAICSQRSISNWVADFGSSEIGVTFDANEMAATPWTDMEKMWDQSPLKYACNAKTPILFIHSLCDYNCPLEQGIEMFTAMKYFGVPSKMVIFEGENHALSRSGKPKHRIRRLKEMTAWFEHYLKENENG